MNIQIKPDCAPVASAAGRHGIAMGLAAAGVAAALTLTPASAQSQKPAQPAAPNAAADEAYRDMEKTLGVVPGFFKVFPQSGVAGAWAEFKAVQLNPATALSGKEKELIGLAVAAQIPCHYCVYFHTRAAQLYGASDEEIREAVAMAAITRHWSTVLNGVATDEAQFRREVDDAMAHAAQEMKAQSTGSTPNR